MIVYVDLENPRLQANSELWKRVMADRLKVKYRLEAISGDDCLIIRYPNINPQLLERLPVRAVLVSGCYTDFEYFDRADLEGLFSVYRAGDWPVLGFCAGMQLLMEAYGARLGPLGPLEPGAPDPYKGLDIPGHVPGMIQERGFMPAQVVEPHPLFSGLGKSPIFYQAHYWEVKGVPSGFQTLASSDLCPIQAIAHRSQPLYGTQFHPESFDQEYPDGERLLVNFFEIVANWSRSPLSTAEGGSHA